MKRIIIVVFIISWIGALPLLTRKLRAIREVQVTLSPVVRQAINATIICSGKIVPLQQVQLSSEVVGKLTEVRVAEGEQVLAGQILAQIDKDVHLTEADQARTAVRLREIEVNRQQILLQNLRRKTSGTSAFLKISSSRRPFMMRFATN